MKTSRKALLIALFGINLLWYPYVSNAQEFEVTDATGTYKYTVLSLAERNVELKEVQPTTDSINIPGSIVYNGIEFVVTRLGNRAFNGTSVKSVILPNSITLVGNNEHPNAFVSSQYSGCFGNCKSLTRVILSENLKAIDGGMFRGCSSLKTIDIPASVLYIGDRAFEYSALENFTGGESVKETSYRSFAGSNLKSFVAPNIEGIGHECFAGCSQLQYVYLGKNIKRVFKLAFNKCDSLSAIVCMSTTFPKVRDLMGDGYLGYIKGGTKPHLYVPCNFQMVEESQWSNAFIVEKCKAGLINVFSNDDKKGQAIITKNVSCSTSVAEVMAWPKDGYNFVKWSDGDTSNPRTIKIIKRTELIAIFE